MKRIFAVFALTLILFILPITVFAQNARQGDSVTLAKNEVIDKDYFAAGNTVFLEGTVNGDAYLAGGNITVNGTVNGDLLVAGGNIDVRGTVSGNIRAAGGNVSIGGPVGRNVSIVGGNINFSSGADVADNLALAGGQITLGGKTGGDVNAATGSLSLAPQSAVTGDLTYYSNNRVVIPQEATVSGKITQNMPPAEQPRETAAKGAAAFLSFFTIASFILAAIIGLLLLKLLPVFFISTADLVSRRPWLSLGVGFLTVIIFPFAFLLLLITIIGIPVAFVLAFALAIYLYLSKIFVAFAIGQLVLNRFNSNTGKIWVFLLGLLIYYVIGLIPIIGWIFSMIVGLIGLGAILISKKNFYQDFRAKEII